MSKEDAMRAGGRRMLIERLKSNPDDIVYTNTPIKNSDMLQLLELSKCVGKSEAVLFAVGFTVDALRRKALEEKLEQKRYVRKETHESSKDLKDSGSDSIRDKSYG